MADFAILCLTAFFLRILYSVATETIPPMSPNHQQHIKGVLLEDLTQLELFTSSAFYNFATTLLLAIDTTGLLQWKTVSLDIKQIVIRFLMLLSTWAYGLLAVLVGMSNGIATRELRRVHIRPESAFRYQYMRRLLGAPLALILIYLFVPYPPPLPFHVCAILLWTFFAAALWGVVGNYRKYL